MTADDSPGSAPTAAGDDERDTDDDPVNDALVSAAFDALPAQVALLDSAGTILATNRAWGEFGVENDLHGDPEMVGENYLAACDAADSETGRLAAEGIRAVLSGERDDFRLEYPCHSPDERRWFTMRAIALRDFEEPHALVMHTNITDRKEAELGVVDQNETLETVASVLSHDLRNPLSVALGRAELVRENADDEGAVLEHTDSVVSALRRMEAIIGDALALARETNVENHEAVDLGAVATTAWSHVETGAATLVVGDSAVVEADASLLEQLLENLFRNAVEHAGPDPTVTVGTLPDGFFVADDGPGIPVADRESVFEAGFTTNRSGGGTGMGLPIVGRIADSHGWDVTLTDDDGGARFEFTGVRLADE